MIKTDNHYYKSSYCANKKSVPTQSTRQVGSLWGLKVLSTFIPHTPVISLFVSQYLSTNAAEHVKEELLYILGHRTGQHMLG